METHVFAHVTKDRLIEYIPVFKESDPKNYKIVFSLPIPYAKKGDIVLVKAQQSVTNDVGEVVEFKSYLVRTKANNEINGEYVVPKMTQSIPPELHHHVGNWVGMDQIPEDGYYFYNLVMWSRYDKAKEGDVLKVEKYGDVSAMIFRKYND